jgi:hypothetical protein
MVATVTLQIPDRLHQRLIHHAEAAQQSLDEVILRVLEIGSPPDWEDVPEAFQAKLAALDRLGDAELWQVARAVRGTHRWDKFVLGSSFPFCYNRYLLSSSIFFLLRYNKISLISSILYVNVILHRVWTAVGCVTVEKRKEKMQKSGGPEAPRFFARTRTYFLKSLSHSRS